MAKRDKGKQQDQQLIDQVSESANDIWLAGLAAFEKAQREGGKVFSKLVKEGEKVEARTLEMAGGQLDEMRAKASGTWDKLENLFEARVQRALHSLGVPTGKEIRHLAKKVDSLGQSVETVGGKKARTAAKPKPKPRAKKATPAAAQAASVKKTTTRRASAKKSAPAAAAPARRASAKKAAPAATTAQKAGAKRPAPAAQARASAKRAIGPRSAPKAAPKTAAQGPDDLKAIGGIGPALERKLNSYGVTSYRQIAGWTSQEVADVESKVIRISGRVSRDNWIAQAKSAQQKKYGK
jgi:poly(hydroxyalkanoate) granule-associated protein